MIEAYLSGANLQGADLLGANLQGANLKDANLQKANLILANLQGAGLSSAELQEAILSDANLQKAYLSDANLQGANLLGTNFQGAYLANANLENAVLNDETDLRGAFLYAANFKDARGLQYAKISPKCIEEVLADRLDEIFINREKLQGRYSDTDEYLREQLKPECRNLGFEEDEFRHFNIYKILEVEYILQPNKKITADEKLKFGIKGKFYEHARDVYVSLKTHFRDIGFYEKSATYFIGEFRVRGKLHKLIGDIKAYQLKEKIKNGFHNLKETVSLFCNMLKSYLLFLGNRLLDLTSSYGESPGKILKTAMLIIVIFAFIYLMLNGIEGVNCAGICRFFKALYFSVVTFTTLGDGAFPPTNNICIRLFVGAEAFVGVFLLSYFVVSVSRKIMR